MVCSAVSSFFGLVFTAYGAFGAYVGALAWIDPDSPVVRAMRRNRGASQNDALSRFFQITQAEAEHLRVWIWRCFGIAGGVLFFYVGAWATATQMQCVFHFPDATDLFGHLQFSASQTFIAFTLFAVVYFVYSRMRASHAQHSVSQSPVYQQSASWAVLVNAIGSTLVCVAILYGSALCLIDEARFDAKAAVADDNAEFLTAYNTRQRGKIIAVVGTYSIAGQDRREPDQYGWIQLRDMNKTIALTGTPAAVCDGDEVAAFGTYSYDDGGGALNVSDPRNIAAESHGNVISRADTIIFAVDPSWCGFN